ncbi:MAG TPA: EAL domain-containing protein [Gallionellaceae bacterium]
MVGLALLLALLSRFVLQFFSVNGIYSIIWPPAGVALAALVIGGRKYWPAVLLGSLVAALQSGSSWEVSCLMAAGDTVQVLLAQWLLTRSNRFDVNLTRPLDYLLLVMAGLGSAVVSGLINSAALDALGLLHGQSLARAFLVEWQGDAFGAALITPLILVWRSWPRDWLKPSRTLELLACFGLAFLAGQVIFIGWFQSTLGVGVRGYWMFMFVVWGALRFGRHGATLIISMTAVQALLGTLHKTGLFATDLVQGGLLNFWFYILALTLVGLMVALIMNARDLARARSVRLTKLYKALSEINQAIVRMERQDELFPLVCRIAVDFGGMRLAWVGQFDEGNQLIVPVARFGRRQDYLDRIRISASADVPEGRGPTGTAFRENRHIVVNNYTSNAWTQPWHTRANHAGWASAAVFPIPRGGKPFAVLSVYHEEEEAFDSEAIALLDEISKDIAFALDNFDREVRRKAAEESMQLAYSVYGATSEGMLVTNSENLIVSVNPAFTRITGYSPEEVLGKDPKMLSSGRHSKEYYQLMWHALNVHGFWQGEIHNRRKDGEEYFEWLTINTIYGNDGKVRQRVALFMDISKQKQADALIRQHAYFDALTKLPNRRLFQDRLDQEIKKSHRTGLPFALLYVDLDRFKEVNDTLGHSVGDTLLIEAAERINKCVRESDTVARLGGDEFTIILTEIGDRGVTEGIANHITQSMMRPFHLGNETMYVSASIGIALYPADATDAENMLRCADQAMYAAKNAGRNRFSYFTSEMQDAALKRLRMLSDLRLALPRQQLHVYYQPIVELASGNITKAEALLRWKHPAQGLISPTEFIPLAEETNLINEIGDWVFMQSAQQAKLWRSKYAADFQISVNKSPVQFRSDETTFARWLEYLDKQELPGSSIVLEITEGLLMESRREIADRLLSFHRSGLQISLDDFGTGYSSLAYLKKFDIDFLKIDQSFVQNMTRGSDDLALCEAIIVMAHKLGIKVIAEGVETAEQRDLLASAGCDYGQGYYFSCPVPAAEFEKLL